jgi:hypothetical protein
MTPFKGKFVLLNSPFPLMEIGTCEEYVILAGTEAWGFSDNGFERSDRDEEKKMTTTNATITTFRCFCFL